MNLINWLGIGVVAATKNTNTKEIMVHLPSRNPTADGRVEARVETKEMTSVNAAGETIKATTMVSNTIPAVWNAMGEANRLTAPDVREGSKVSVYQIGGQNRYYWTTQGMNSETYRQETIVWGFQANPTQDEDTPFNIDDYFTITVDTRSGFFGLRTSQAAGENSALELKMDGGNGRLDFRGSGGTVLSVDDFNDKFTYFNSEGTTIGVDKKKVGIIAPESILLNAEKSINVITETLNIHAKEVNVKADKASVAIPETDWLGLIRLVGTIEQTGNIEQVGHTISTGVVQGLTAVMTAKTNLDTHFHGGVDNGDGVTSPPVV